jgi:hypothetical protein
MHREGARTVESMKYLMRALLVAAIPYILRALAQRLNSPSRNAPAPRRRGMIIEGEKIS